MPLLCLVLEFEPIYRKEAKRGQSEAGKRFGRGKDSPAIIDGKAIDVGRSYEFMARDSAAGRNSIKRVLYIREHDPGKFKALKELISG